MKGTEKILKSKPVSPTLDFNFLREQGMKYLRRIAGKVWTDYNLHDPGVTILEQLCYAITDLGYRASFKMEDILAINPESPENKNFYTAAEILPCNPVMINDFRKVLIDVEGIKNAWLEKTTKTETNFFVDEINKKLSYELSDTSKKPVELNGLYKIILEFDYDKDYEDLNSNSIKEIFKISSGVLNGFELTIKAVFPYWDDKHLDWGNPGLFKNYLQSFDIQYEPEYKSYLIEISINNLEIDVKIWNKSQSSPKRENQLEEKLKQNIDSFIYLRKIENQFGIVEKYRQKLILTSNIIHSAKNRLHAHRNLCEDFIKFESLKVEDISICAEIEISPDGSGTEILSKVYYEIDKFLSPDISFYSLEELLKKGKSTDDIFEGPKLNNGFIDNDELIKSDRRKYIHVSDFIQIIMSINGVKAVRNIKLANMYGPGASGKNIEEHQWCMKLDQNGQSIPRLNIDTSSVSFYKEGVPQLANLEKVKQKIIELKYNALEENIVFPQMDIPLPKGNYRDLSNYQSLQYDFPLSYGIGKYGLSEKVSQERKAQARQLKAYLLHMEQLLANYMSQLSHMSELFSMDSSIDSTSFSQSLYHIPSIAPMFKDFMELYNFDGQEEYADKKVFQAKWEEYTASTNNEYIKQLNLISEGKNEKGESIFELRRNKFLDHLMARFCENFVDYATLAYDMEGEKSNKELIHDKIKLLKDYPVISANRGKAFHYADTKNTWDTYNVTGLEKRIARLLGIESFQRRKMLDYCTLYTSKDGKYRWRIYDQNDKIILNSEQSYTTKEEIPDVYRKIKRNIYYDKFIQTKTNKKGQFYFNILDVNGEIIGRSQEYQDTPEERSDKISYLRNFIRQREEGLHLIEHILLRPRIKNSDAFFPIDMDDSNQCLDETDPYSFKITVILPSWPERFKHMEFRKFVEQSIMLETPAHIFVKICWVNMDQMDQFEDAYREWLKINATINFDIANFMAEKDLSTLVHEYCLKINTICKQTTVEKIPIEKFTLNNLNKIIKKLNSYFKQKQKNKKTPDIDSLELTDLYSQFFSLKQAIEKLTAIGKLTESQNKLLTVIKSLRNVYPYAILRDNTENLEGEYPVSLDNTILGTFKSL